MDFIKRSYALLRPLIFYLDPETAHSLVLRMLNLAYQFGLLNASYSLPTTVMGITFPNPIGLAAGMDKNGEYIDALAALGFGYIEVGTVTPRAQLGNPKPRLFRISQAQAIINRMGFNNNGVAALIENLKKSRYQGILGINIGKNIDTPTDKAVQDYLFCLRQVYCYADYITVNISSPNTKNLRALQNAKIFDHLLNALKAEQKSLAAQYKKYIPLVIKISPDLDEQAIERIAKTLIAYEIDGVISSNTTVSREEISSMINYSHEIGGLSGAPLRKLANKTQNYLVKALAGKIPVLGSGGIMCAQDALLKVKLGAQLIQLYSGLIYQGPSLVRDCVRVLNPPL